MIKFTKKIRMKTKKGFLMGEYTVNVLIAILALLALSVISYQTYSTVRGKTDLEKAEGHLENIMRKLENLREGGAEKYFLYSPKDWNLILWPLPKSGDFSVPKRCSDSGLDRCLCICPDDFFLIKSCDDFGACMEVPYKEVEMVKGGNYKNIYFIEELLDDEEELLFSVEGEKLTINVKGFKDDE